MSEAALLESIRIEMKMLAENGGQYLVLTPAITEKPFPGKNWMWIWTAA